MVDEALTRIAADERVIEAAEAVERWHETNRASSTPSALPCSCALCEAVRARRELS